MAEMIAMEGPTRMKINKKFVEKMKKNALRLHIPRHLIGKRLLQANGRKKLEKSSKEEHEQQPSTAKTDIKGECLGGIVRNSIQQQILQPYQLN